MIRRRTKFGQGLGYVLSTLAVAAVAWFSYHTVQGNRGLVEHSRLRGEIAEAEARLAALSAERQALEARVQGLRPTALDGDLLEERARLVIGYVKPNELILLD